MDKRIRKRFISYIPELLVLFVCMMLLTGEICAKEGYHMDELLSFELANAEFNPWIVPTQPQGRLAKYVQEEIRGENFKESFQNFMETLQDVVVNRGSSKLLSYRADVYEEPVWIEREVFRDYITVGEKDKFSYLSVYFNVKDDNHPPLHFMLLHTVSSLFPAKIVPAMGCVLNLAAVMGVMLLLMWLGRQIMKIWGYEKWGRGAGLFAAACYGLSVGAVSTTLLIRMYALVTLWCVATLTLHIRKLYGSLLGSGDFTKHNRLLILVTVAGFLTQYFFLFYCLILAAVTVVILWKTNRCRELLCYIRSMLLAAVLGIGIFPFAISDVFASGRGVEALENLSDGFSGFGSRVVAFGQILWQETGITGILFLVFVAFGVIKWSCGLFRILRHAATVGKEKAEKEAGLQSLLWIPAAGYFLLAARMSPYLVNRYIMPLFPLVILAVTMQMGKVLAQNCQITGQGKHRKTVWIKALAAVLLAGQLVSGMVYESPYLYRGYGRQKKISEAYREYACVCIYQGVGYYENLVEFTEYKETLLVTLEELSNRRETNSFQNLSQAVVLVKAGVEKESVKKVLREKYGWTVREIYPEEASPYGDTLWLAEAE